MIKKIHFQPVLYHTVIHYRINSWKVEYLQKINIMHILNFSKGMTEMRELGKRLKITGTATKRIFMDFLNFFLGKWKSCIKDIKYPEYPAKASFIKLSF